MQPMITSLMQARAYDHPVESVRLLETHLSWVLLTGRWAYKIRKPVDVGFVDLRSQAARLHCAEEELRLNRRLCADLYVGLRPIFGPPERASLHPGGEVIDVAVQMHQFDQRDLVLARLAHAPPDPGQWLDLANRLASFHGAAAVARAEQPWGEPAAVLEPALANLTLLAGLQSAVADRALLAEWTINQHRELEGHLRRRKARGRVREGHGDLHLGNLVVRSGQIDPFDCLEFSPSLRWIDVVSDMAFLVMDLQRYGHSGLAAAVLNRWLDHTGDYQGLWLWRWYVVYRALVRAKVAALRLNQQPLGADRHDQLTRELQAYVDLASESIQRPPGPIVITHGVSGTGKSWLSRQLCDQLGWIHLRSDVERRRRFGRYGQQPDGPAQQGDPYTPEISHWLYGSCLPDLAEAVSRAGFGVIVDATFLRQHQRQGMQQRARDCGAEWLILDLQGQVNQALGRVQARCQLGDDPSEADAAVLARQQLQLERLCEEEIQHSLPVSTNHSSQGIGDELMRRCNLRTTR